MHFKDDPVSDMHAKNSLIISCLKHFPGPTKFGPVFWSRLFRRGPVEYNYPPQCSLTFLLERFLHRCREQSFAIRAYAMSAVGIDVVSSHTKYCRIAYGITR